MRPTVESLALSGDVLDACEFRRQGLLTNQRAILRPGIGIWKWKLASQIEANAQCLTITYRGSDRQSLVPISYMQVGDRKGTRPYLLCPICGKKRWRLYASFEYCCAQCIGAKPKCRIISARKRKLQRIDKLLARVGIHGRPYYRRKPLGIWRRTFRRVQRQVDAIEQSMVNTRTRASHTRLKPVWRVMPRQR